MECFLSVVWTEVVASPETLSSCSGSPIFLSCGSVMSWIQEGFAPEAIMTMGFRLGLSQGALSLGVATAVLDY